VVLDDTKAGLRSMFFAPDTAAVRMMVNVPEAGAADSGGGPFATGPEPAPEQAANANAVNIAGTRVRRFIFSSFVMAYECDVREKP